MPLWVQGLTVENWFYISSGLVIFTVLLLVILVVMALVDAKKAKMAKENTEIMHKIELEKVQNEARLAEKDGRIFEQSKKLEILEKENSRLIEENTRIKSDLQNTEKYFSERLKDIENNKQELTLKFKEVSNEIIKSQNQQFGEEQKKSIDLLLKPFKEQMTDFRTKIEKVHEDNIKNKGSFDEQFNNLLSLNKNLSKDAQDLADALKGGKKLQGNWGELQLESILDISGLKKDFNYETQKSFTTDDNKRYILDAVIRLPNNRNVIVDSKVSLNDYVKYSQCESDEERKCHLKNHVACIRGHIDELSAKEYQKLMKIDTLDYVVIFVPIESAFVDAVSFDASLYDYAFKKNVMISTPSSLLPILRTIENLWRIENQNKNAVRIAELGGSLYDKLSNFVEDMEKINRALLTASGSYDSAMKKLKTGKGNALSIAEKMKAYGAKTSKNVAVDFDGDEELLQIEQQDEVEG